MKKMLVLIVFSIFSLTIHAQNATINHIVKKGETLYQLSAKYKVGVDLIKSTNPHIVGDNIKSGDRLMIPLGAGANTGTAIEGATSVSVRLDGDIPLLLEDDFDKFEPTPMADPVGTPPAKHNDILKEVKDIITDKDIAAPTPSPDKFVETTPAITPPTDDPDDYEEDEVVVSIEDMKPVKHIVKAGETLFSLSKVYSEGLNALRNWNDLKNDNLSVGQELIVSWIVPNSSPDTPNSAATSKVSNDVTSFQHTFFQYLADPDNKQKAVKQNGIATWFDDKSTEHAEKNMYVLHKTAPLHSVIKVTNPMNQKSVYLKVLERLPEAGEFDNVLLRMTSTAAKQLNILDSRAVVECTHFE